MVDFFEIHLFLRDCRAAFNQRGVRSRTASIATSFCVLFILLTHIAMKLPGRLNAALRTSEERLQDIIDNTTAVIFVKDLDLQYLLVNSEFERRHQVQRDQFRGKTDFDIDPYEVAEAVRANDRQVIEAGVPIQFEETVPSAEGERSHVSLKFLLRDRTGEPYAICGIANPQLARECPPMTLQQTLQ